jgi:hypothetical protein
MNARENKLASGMIDDRERRIGNLKLRPFSFGSMQLAYMLNLTLFTGGKKEDFDVEFDDDDECDPDSDWKTDRKSQHGAEKELNGELAEETDEEHDDDSTEILKPVELDETETQRQIITFAWMQSAPLDEVVTAVLDGTAERCVLKFAFGITFEMIPVLMAEINRISAMVAASSVRVESKHPSDEGDAPGKS